MIPPYNEDLAKVERFMVRSKIRNYCVKICKGACCHGCNDRCSSKERRLPCSAHICPSLLSFVNAFLKSKGDLTDFRDIVMRVYYSARLSEHSDESLVDRCYAVARPLKNFPHIHYQSNARWKKLYRTHPDIDQLYNDSIADKVRPAIEALLKDKIAESNLIKAASGNW